MKFVVRCEKVTKSYGGRKPLGIKELLVGKNRRVGRFVREHALQEVSFGVRRGEAFGVIGPNGGGKSTLLALILGVLVPDSGGIQVDGRIASLLALGAGFHPELSGRQNVFLYGSILGMTLREIRGCFDDIVAFSELGDAIDNPLRTYSSGMITRLGFSTIIHTPADILLIDEVLAVGDAEFQEKCGIFLSGFKEKGGTLVIVSHDMGAIQSICDKGICLSAGRIAAEGKIKSVVDAYDKLIHSPVSTAATLKK